MSAQVQIIERDGKPEYAVVPFELYEQLLSLAEDAKDIAAADAAMAEIDRGEDEIIPGDIAHRLLAGENPVRVWREHRNLTQEDLATAAGVGKSYVSQIEGGKKPGSVTVLKRMARALRVDLDDLAPSNG